MIRTASSSLGAGHAKEKTKTTVKVQYTWRSKGPPANMASAVDHKATPVWLLLERHRLETHFAVSLTGSITDGAK